MMSHFEASVPRIVVKVPEMIKKYVGSTPLALKDPMLFLWKSDSGKSVLHLLE